MTEPQSGAAVGHRFFDAHQRATIEAAMARVIPTDDQPGAREAETVEFLDRYLSGIGFIYAKPDGSGFEKLEGKRAQAWQQRIAALRSKYTEGIRQLDQTSKSRFGSDFVKLTTEQQDEILAGLEQPERQSEAAFSAAQAVSGLAPVEPALQQTNAEIELDFFPLLALHTRQGYYADPIYGGNKNRVGWKLIGFEGPESLAETHAGRFTTLPFFAHEQIDWEKEKTDGG
ncbi:MAG TPA: gluconate 2-dehydrogenase subunit 3 family protein [Chthoniobacterales bacterium]